MSSDKLRIRFIDGWRAVAVFLVIAVHFRAAVDAKGDLATLQPAAMDHLGYVGVLIFFFISGFVVSKRCLEEFHREGNFSIIGFYIRRIFRITPPLLIYLIFCFLIGFTPLGGLDLHQAASSSLYLCNNKLVDCGWLAGHTWSLAFEEQFYLLFPVLFSYLVCRKMFSPVALMVGLFSASLPLIWPLHFVGRIGFIIIYSLFILGYISARHPSLLNIAKRIAIPLFLVSAAATLFPADLFAKNIILSDAYRFEFVKYYKLIYILSIPCLVLSAGTVGGILTAVLESKPLVGLGQASYSIYLWQQLATNTQLIIDEESRIVLLAIIIVGCLLAYRYAERPMIRFGNRLSVRWRDGFNRAPHPVERV